MSATALELPMIEEEGLQLGPVEGAQDRFRFAGTGEAEGAAHLTQLLADISRYLARPWDPQSLPRPFVPPMGAPIGEP